MKPNWFVGLPVAAASWLASMTADLPESCRAFDARDVHMTVAFLGAVEPAGVSAVIDLLNAVEERAFFITLGRVLALPTPKRVSALSLEPLEGIARARLFIEGWRERFCRAAGCRPDPRPPLPHITVARPKRKAGHEGRQQALDWSSRVKAPTQRILLDHVALYTWADDRRLRQFRIVAEKALVSGHETASDAEINRSVP